MAADSSSTHAKKSSSLLLRVVLIVVLAAAIFALLTDGRNRRECETAYNKLSALLPTEEQAEAGGPSVTSPNAQKVREVLGREPASRSEQDGEIHERYVWPGAIKSYAILVVYVKGPEPLVQRIRRIE